MALSGFQQTFSGILEQQLLLAEELASLLQQELETLGQRDADELARLSELKLQLSGQLEQETAALARLLSEHGLRLDQSGVRECLTTPELKQRWQTLQDLLTGCRDGNRLNGNLIEISKYTTQKMLRLLTGDTASTELYGSAGKVDHSMGSSRLAKA